jgi:hypothetical protein
MQIETVGKYQLHLIVHEVSESGQWDPYLAILRFDDDAQDFKCVVEKRRVSDHAYSDYDEAIEAARRAGNSLLASGRL